MSLQGFDPSEVDSPAEAAAAIGERIFPLVAGSKIPAVEGGLNAACDDPAVHAWWREEHPNCNWGLNCGRSGYSVIDIDGEAGEQSWAVLCLTYMTRRLPAKLKTLHGRHLYFRGRLLSSVSKLGAGLDIRSLGGYVVIPPSTVDVPWPVRSSTMRSPPCCRTGGPAPGNGQTSRQDRAGRYRA